MLLCINKAFGWLVEANRSQVSLPGQSTHPTRHNRRGFPQYIALLNTKENTVHHGNSSYTYRETSSEKIRDRL